MLKIATFAPVPKAIDTTQITLSGGVAREHPDAVAHVVPESLDAHVMKGP